MISFYMQNLYSPDIFFLFGSTGVCVRFALLMTSVAVLVARVRKRDRWTKQRLESDEYCKDKELGAVCMNDSSLPFFVTKSSRILTNKQFLQFLHK